MLNPVSVSQEYNIHTWAPVKCCFISLILVKEPNIHPEFLDLPRDRYISKILEYCITTFLGQNLLYHKSSTPEELCRRHLETVNKYSENIKYTLLFEFDCVWYGSCQAI